MSNDSYNGRIQDIGPDQETGGTEEGRAQMSSYNSLIYDLITERRKGSIFGLCF